MNAIPGGANPAFHYKNGNHTVCTASTRQYAITVRHAKIQYKDVLKAIISGGGPSVNVVLNDFNMTVEKGHIYGLLGSSGCGKTSILRAIVGQHDLTEGEIRVLGHRPKTPESGIPGTTVGYMPQELCLLEEFTIKESLYFYGKLGGMNSDEIDAKCDYFVKFLELPKPNRIVGTLSGGQRRRVSFAVALLHSPPVLILDEPTVGVDPLLRASIWEYLTKLTRSNRTTVLITTHYIEEASQADTVGLMRHGKLMAEQSPRELMQTLHCTSLEEVLLKLCVLQSTKKLPISSVNDAIDLPMLPKVNDKDEDLITDSPVRPKVSSLQRLRALAWKDSVLNIRHYVFLLIVVLLPVICMSIFCLSFGGTPTRLKISIFNQESNCLSSGMVPTNSYGAGNITNCDMPGFLSCKVIESLQDKGIVLPIAADSESSAENDVRRGRSWAAMTFSKNFTAALMQRAKYSLYDVPEDIIEQGTIQVAMDQADRIISNLLQDHMVVAVKRVLKDVNDVCHNLRHAKDLPMQFKKPIYGREEISGVLDTTLPGAIASVIYMFPCTTTLATLMPGKIQGTLERGLIAGVKMSEVMVSLFIVCLIPSLFITAGALIIPYETFGLLMTGSYWTMAGTVIPLMATGMLLGFVIALFCRTMTAAFAFTMFFWFSCIFTSGAVWPVQGSYPLARPFFWVSPLTLPTEAIRHIAIRGWTMCFQSLQITLASIGLWATVYILIIAALLKYSQ